LNFTSRTSPEFWALFNGLPQAVQEQPRKQFELFAQNPLSPVAAPEAGWFFRVSASFALLPCFGGAPANERWLAWILFSP